jgi:catechol 2,3-dioxygenase-like lactoylglutathione lyase family enzyme
MHFASIRTITDDVDRLVRFYEQVTGLAADRPNPLFAEFVMPSGFRFDIGHTDTTRAFGADSVRPADNHSTTFDFRVDDVDDEYERLQPLVDDWVLEPATMPWGNRSILFRDPDGNLVNLYAPVTEEAKARLGA